MLNNSNERVILANRSAFKHREMAVLHFKSKLQKTVSNFSTTLKNEHGQDPEASSNNPDKTNRNVF